MVDLLKNDQLRQAVGDQAYDESNSQLKHMFDHVLRMTAIVVIPVFIFALLMTFARRIADHSLVWSFFVDGMPFIILVIVPFAALRLVPIFRRRWHNKKLNSISRALNSSNPESTENLYYINSPKGNGYVEPGDRGVLFRYPDSQPLLVDYPSIRHVVRMVRKRPYAGIAEPYCVLFSDQGVFTFRIVDKPGERPSMSTDNISVAGRQALLYTHSINKVFYATLSKHIGTDRIQDLQIAADYEHKGVIKIVVLSVVIITVIVLFAILLIPSNA